MANPHRLAEYAKGVCPLLEDLDSTELAEYEAAAQADGTSIYTEYLKVEVKADGAHWFHRCDMCEEIHEKVLPIETDFVYIGQGPSEDDRYSKYTSWLTCQALIIQLRNTFGNEPEGARLYLRSEMGGGGYKEVVCEYDTRFPLSYAYAMMLEGNLPAKWSASALTWLAEHTQK